VIELLMEETRQAMGQIGTPTLAALGEAEIYRPGLPAAAGAGKVAELV